jgi:hypothetical protein
VREGGSNIAQLSWQVEFGIVLLHRLPVNEERLNYENRGKFGLWHGAVLEGVITLGNFMLYLARIILWVLTLFVCSPSFGLKNARSNNRSFSNCEKKRHRTSNDSLQRTFSLSVKVVIHRKLGQADNFLACGGHTAVWRTSILKQWNSYSHL